MIGRGHLFRHVAVVVVAAMTLGVVSLRPVPVVAAPPSITFEESIPNPGSVTSQYCNNVASNKGVLFHEPVRLIEPAVGTMSPTHAATNRFIGDEFSEPNVMRVSFTTDQSLVSMRVGLDRAYSQPITAELRVYTSAIPGPATELTDERDSVVLGTTATAIEHELFATSPGTEQRFRSLEVEFTGPAGATGHEVIDDLVFSAVGPPCGSDDNPPTVEIIEPAAGTPFYGSPSGGRVPLPIHLQAIDSGTGIASVDVDFLDAGSNRLEGFSVCGGASAPACPLPSALVERAFTSSMPAETAALRVTAQDFAGNQRAAVRPLTITASTANVWAGGLEITQAVQPWLAENPSSRRAANLDPVTFGYPSAPMAVPLVAGRTTVVRLFARVEGTIGDAPLAGVGGVLRCYAGLSYLVPCPGPSVIYPEQQPPNTTAVVTVDPSQGILDQRRASTLTLNFVLPDAWTTVGAISLEATTSSPVPECAGCTDAANAIRVHTISFREVPAWTGMVRQVLVDRGLGTATATERADNLDWIRRVYPVDESTVIDGWRILPTQLISFGGGAPGCSAYLDYLSAYAGHVEQYLFRKVWALTDSNTPQWCSGLARPSEGVAVSRGDRWDAGAHEVGHTFGLLHSGNPGFEAECQDPALCDSDWPWPNGGTGAFGFDVLRFEVNDPGSVEMPAKHDIMTYADPSTLWISWRNWIRLFNAMAGWSMPYPKATAASATTASVGGLAVAAMTPTQHLLVRGRYDSATGQWRLLPIYEVMRIPGVPEAETADLTVELTDGAGGVLATHAIDLPEGVHVDTGDPSVVEIPDPSFVRFIELPPGTEDVNLREEATILDSRSRSASRPEVALVEPTSSGFDGDIRWAWSDTDGDALRAMVEYQQAPDASWLPLAIDYADDFLAIDPAQLPGGSAARVRVTVTDGLNSATSLSETFSMPDLPPTVEIISPNDDDRFEAGRRIVLRGVAADPEDDALPGEALVWASDRDGLLGSGGELELAGLSAGTHTITLTGTDSVGNSDSTAVVVEVDEPAIVNHQPTANAGPAGAWSQAGTHMLDGTGSSDPDGDPLAYHWSIVSAPAGATVWLDDSDSAQPTAHASMSGTYEFALIVHDGSVGSLPDTVSVGPDTAAPTTTVVLSPLAPDGLNEWYVSPVTVTLTSVDTAGSGVDRTEYSLNGAPWSLYSVPIVVGDDGIWDLGARSVDLAGNVEDPVVGATIRLDQTDPAPTLTAPAAGSSAVDGITVSATSVDTTSGTETLWFTIREWDESLERPVGLERLEAEYDGSQWVYDLDTTQLVDGAYVVWAKAQDDAGNLGSSVPTRFVVHNWEVRALFPAAPTKRAGRTLPIKFSLRMAPTADPSMTFVRREDLAVVIYETANPSVILQSASFGPRSSDYRIDEAGRFYITNFTTARQPAQYTVEVTRGGFVLGTFTFSTS